MPSEPCWLHLGGSGPCAVGKVNCHEAWCALGSGRQRPEPRRRLCRFPKGSGVMVQREELCGPVHVLFCGLCRVLKAESLGLQAPPGTRAAILEGYSCSEEAPSVQSSRKEWNICSLNFLPVFSSPDICQVSRCVLCRGKNPTPVSEALYPALPQPL